MVSPTLPVFGARRWLAGAGAAVRDLLLPPRCVACDGDFQPPAVAAAARPLLLCETCRREIPTFTGAVCARCLAPVPVAAGVELPCGWCRQWQPKFARALAAGPYEGLLRLLLLRNKVDTGGVLARTLIDLVWERCGESLAALNVDVVAAPPMSWRRRWQRGVCAQAELARAAARRLGVPAAPGMLRLRREVAPQLGMSRAGRLRNLHGEMQLARGYRLDAAHVLVVDDILTTGATCSEAARVLLKSGAREVSALVVARTPPG
ncbi:MAG: ComF family protein [Planctomycetales bacterium]|nr:ComF family protein [Planctomycetales bacterium]